MSIDFAATYASLYSRAASASAGTALRALLGSSASVFPAERLGNVAGVVLPWLVWRAGAVSGGSGDIRSLNAAWWIYAAPGSSNHKMHTIASAIDALYGSTVPFAIDGGRIGVTFIGQPLFDEALALNGLEVRIGFRQLG